MGEGQDALLTVRAVPISRGEGEGGVNKQQLARGPGLALAQPIS